MRLTPSFVLLSWAGSLMLETDQSSNGKASMLAPSSTTSEPDRLAATVAPAALKAIATSPAINACSDGGPPAI